MCTCFDRENKFCLERYGNGFCDEQCNNIGCLYDGLDCEEIPEYAHGVLIVYVIIDYQEMLTVNRSQVFLQDMSVVLNTVVLFAPTADNQNKIEPWESDPRAVRAPVKRDVLVVSGDGRLTVEKREVNSNSDDG